jgi:hypothetical protein
MHMPDYDPFEDPLKTPEPDTGKDKPADPEPAAPAISPEQQAAIDAANRRADAAEARMSESQKSYEQKLEGLTASLSERYREKVDQQDPTPTLPDLKDADFDKAPAELVQKVALDTSEMVAKKEVQGAMQELNQRYSVVMGNLAEQAFESQMEGLRSERFYEELKDDVRAFFDDNPGGKVNPQAARMIYQQYVGQNLDKLLEKEAVRKEGDRHSEDDLIHQRIVRPDVRSEPGGRTPAPRGSVNTPRKEAELGEDEQKICDIFTHYGVFDGADDWNQWKEVLGGSRRKDVPLDYARGKVGR